MWQHNLEGDSPSLQWLLLHCLWDYNKTAEEIRLEESLPYYKNVSKNNIIFPQILTSPNRIFFWKNKTGWPEFSQESTEYLGIFNFPRINPKF